MSSTTPTTTPFRPGPPPAKKQRMSISQTYYLAHTARGKLSREAAKGEHNLRRLVGHANLLDALMIDLADAEREQEAWLDATVSTHSRSAAAGVKWVDTLQTIPDGSDSESDDDDAASDCSDDDEDLVSQIAAMPAIRRARSPPPAPQQYDDDSDDDCYDDDEFEPELALVRTPSHRHSQPPELVHDNSDESDDEPASPPLDAPHHPLVPHFAAAAAAKSTPYAGRHSPMVAAY